MDGFVARQVRWKVFLLFALSLLFVVLGLWLAGAIGEGKGSLRALIGWSSVILFGLGSVVLARQLSDASIQVIVDDQGVFYRRYRAEIIPWGEIDHVDAVRMRGQKFLCVWLRDPEKFRPTGVKAQVLRWNRNSGYGDFAISMTGMDRSFRELTEAVARYRSGLAAGDGSSGGDGSFWRP